ncbi:MAG: acyl-CoA thioesterase [Ignavibacteriae bacterium]|nr:MAG: acyl-CoA thioesterase [Ignavibacteriota bacterium]
MITSELKIRVLYAHTDKMGVVYYGRYFEYYEAGRNEFLRRLGYPYSRIESQDIILPVIHAESNYFAPALYDDEIVLQTMLCDIPTVKIKIYYILKNSKGEKLAEGHTIHSFVNAITRKPMRPPSDFIEIVKSKMDSII